MVTYQSFPFVFIDVRKKNRQKSKGKMTAEVKERKYTHNENDLWALLNPKFKLFVCRK